MKENLEQIKIGLLGVIALVLVLDTFFLDKNGSSATASADGRPAIGQTANVGTANNPAVPQNNDFNVTGQIPSNATQTNNPTTQPVQAEPPKPKGPPTTMTFAQMSHDFGNIEQDTENKHVFKFTNTGDNPLLIENAVGSCGCTVPEYPKTPIAPGETGEIKVVYKPAKQQNQQQKTVTITANTEPATTQLTISAFVNPGEEAEG